jgi:hypothetical protein
MRVVAEARWRLVELARPLDIDALAAVDDDVVHRRVVEVGLKRA